jgi:glyoxylate reductase
VKVLASRPLPGPAWAELDDVEYLDGALPEALGRRPREDVEALAVVGDRVDGRALDLLPAVRVVANYGVGYDSIDVDECHRRGVAVTNTPGVLDAAVADLTLALILAVRRRVVEADRYVRAGRWERGWAETSLLGDDVEGMLLGILGLGRIGRAVARRARPFGMRIAYAQRRRLDAAVEAELGAEFMEIDELLARADVVTIHVPLTAETGGLVDARRLALLRDGAALVNTSRGDVVEQDALVRELVSGRIRAALDVFTGEPGAPAELRELSNVVLTPHVGSATVATREAMTRLVVDNLLAAAAGRPLVTPV